MELKYVRTDKNGTKIFNDWTCQRCGGAGASDKWAFTGKVCYECGGTGKRRVPKIVKEYTTEYAGKLEKRRLIRLKKNLAENPPLSQEEMRELVKENRKRIWETQGFRKDGIGYIHSGNTYANRESLYKAGAKWNNFLKSYIAPEPVDGLKGITILEMHAQEICNSQGYVDMDKAHEIREGILNEKI